jgi:cobalt/nickel transport system permease protein
MIGVHVLIGIGEALITLGAWSFIRQTRPDLLGGTALQAARGSGWIAAGLLIALAVTLASPLADPNPDGLERVAEDTGFLQAAQSAPYEIIPDYQVPAVQEQALSTIAAGVIGVLLVAGVGFGVARLSKTEHSES